MTLEDAVALAARAHRGQRDKAGEPYILHALRVMMRVEDAAVRIVAVLHDVLEDTSVTITELREAGCSEEALSALEALTRREGESYADFIERVAQNPLARRVKLADLADNMDLDRLPEVRERDRARLARYKAAWEKLAAAERARPSERRLR